MQSRDKEPLNNNLPNPEKVSLMRNDDDSLFFTDQELKNLLDLILPENYNTSLLSIFSEEMLLYILSFLDNKSLLRMGKTCRFFRTLSKDKIFPKFGFDYTQSIQVACGIL